MKAVSVETAADVARARSYRGAADLILFDARAPAASTRPGGNGAPFDWHALRGVRGRLPYVLSGGLTPANVAEAIRVSGARAVDVSSGVESRPGKKEERLIRDFIRAAKSV
jgi:phosphoribosylanthranilate isomerase